MTDTLETLARSLGAAIKAQRNKNGLTQEDVAHAADLSLRHYQQVESGRMNATLRSIHNIAVALKVEVHLLFASGNRLRAKTARRTRGS